MNQNKKKILNDEKTTASHNRSIKVIQTHAANTFQSEISCKRKQKGKKTKKDGICRYVLYMNKVKEGLL